MGQATSVGLYTYIDFISCKTQALKRQLYNCSTADTHVLDGYLENLKSRGDQIFNLQSLTMFGSDISICLMTEIRANPKIYI